MNITKSSDKLVKTILEQDSKDLNEIIIGDTNDIYYEVITDPENPDFKGPYFQKTDQVNDKMTIAYDEADDFEIYYSPLKLRLKIGNDLVEQWVMFNVTDLKKIIEKMSNKKSLQNTMIIVNAVEHYKAELKKARMAIQAEKEAKAEEAKVAAKEAEKVAKIEELETLAREIEKKARIKEELEANEILEKKGYVWKDRRDDLITNNDLPNSFKIKVAHAHAERADALNTAIKQAIEMIDKKGGKKKSTRRRKSARRGKSARRRKSVRRRKLMSRR
jgi:hypothetical protein